MFTGLIETMGTLSGVRTGGRSLRLSISPDDKNFDAPIGSSVAVDGICLTVVACGQGEFHFDAVAETLSKTTFAAIRPGKRVNLERALRADSRLDGHFVSGHVDSTAVIQSDIRAGESVIRSFEFDSPLLALVAPKGSVSVDGISLTVSGVYETGFSVSLIPHTMQKTTLMDKKAGDAVNIECDLFARYIFRILGKYPAQSAGNNNDDKLYALLEQNRF